jgi:hypothetical protein
MLNPHRVLPDQPRRKVIDCRDGRKVRPYGVRLANPMQTFISRYLYEA